MEQNKLYYITENNKKATLTIDKFSLDVGTMKQIREIMLNPTVENPVFMPDVHAGIGSCVGLTCKLTDKIVPAFISGDIGCGISAYGLDDFDKLSTTYQQGYFINKMSMGQIDDIIRNTIPIDNGRTHINETIVVSSEDLDNTFYKACEIGHSFCKSYKNTFNVDINKYMPNYNLEWLKNTCLKIKSDFDYDMRCIGTPRGGNHYVEINKNDNDKYYLSTHCGSCNFGTKIYQYHQSKISDNNKLDWQNIDEQMDNIKRKIKNPKQLKLIRDQIVEDARNNLHKCYLEGEEAYEYFFDMIFAQCYASLNRLIIIKRILTNIGYDMKNFIIDNIIESVHNYIDFNDMIIRKGAIKLHKNEIGIVALNMRDGFLLVKSTDNEEIIKNWNYSCCHGCGRDYPRFMVKHKHDMSSYIKSMKNVYSKSIVNETLDECPNAYRNPKIIIDALNNRVNILDNYKTVINIKGY